MTNKDEFEKIETIGHLDFVFNYRNMTIHIRDNYSKKEWRLIPSGRHTEPFDIVLERHLPNDK